MPSKKKLAQPLRLKRGLPQSGAPPPPLKGRHSRPPRRGGSPLMPAVAPGNPRAWGGRSIRWQDLPPLRRSPTRMCNAPADGSPGAHAHGLSVSMRTAARVPTPSRGNSAPPVVAEIKSLLKGSQFPPTIRHKQRIAQSEHGLTSNVRNQVVFLIREPGRQRSVGLFPKPTEQSKHSQHLG